MNNIPERFRKRIQEAKEKKLKELDLSNTEVFRQHQKAQKVRFLETQTLLNLLEFGEELSVQNQVQDLTEDQDKLTKIPEEVFGLTYLKVLKLSYNRISSLPESLGNLTNLTELCLSGNQLSSLPESLGNLTNLTKLYLSGNQLSSLPESLGDLTNLTELYLGENKLSSLPESLGNLTSLTKLDLKINQLSSLPESLGNLTNLTKLFLWENKLSVLPESLGNLTNLAELDLRENQLLLLSESLSNLTNLTKLILWNNQLSLLPESLGKLTNLTELYLGGNQLSLLPESLGKLTNLTELYLGGNQLLSLPESLGDLTNLTKLFLSDNPLVKPPIEVAEQGIEKIRKYFRQLKEEGVDYIYEAKLIIVGEAGAGKTTLAKKIDNPNYKLNEGEKHTEGINIIKYIFTYPDKEHNKRNFQINIWDFGGQEIYYATHQFFLSKRSLYALVADTCKEDTDFYYWLNVVELLSDNSPLLIIKNEKYDHKLEINETGLRGQFTNLEKTLATNLATNKGLGEVITNIWEYIKKLPHMGQALPKTWVKVRQTLEQDDRNYISLQEYLNICEANGFTRLEDKLQLSEYLHDLGVCLHFQDKEDSLLYRTVILKPEWGTEAVYKVLENKQVVNKQGKFTRSDLKTIWYEERYAERRGELLELMKKFQLCYEIPNNKDTLIAPQLLSDNQPQYKWNESKNLILRYTYPDFMPKGIITRFIVVMHENIDQQYVWKSGVILTKDNTKAEVIEYYGKREIRIRVCGDNQRDFMTVVTHELDRINNSFKGLKYQKLIPCNCEVCKDSQSPFTYEFNKILERYSNNKLTIECNKRPYHEVQVLGLIDNVVSLEQLVQQLVKNEEQVNNEYKDFLKEIVRIQAGRTIKMVAKFMTSEGNTYNQEKVGIGHMSGGTIEDGAKVAGVINEAEQQDLTQAAEEIQKLLEQLSESNPTTTSREKAAVALEVVDTIEAEPALKTKVINALKAGGTEAFKEAVNHPLVNVLVAMIEGWQENT